MDALDLLRDLAARPRHAASTLADQLDPATLNAHPGNHPNSVAWLIWHTGREIDAQLAALTGADEVWESGGFAERTGLGALGAGIGYGHSDAEARRIRVDGAGPLLDYLTACFDAVDSALDGLAPEALDEIVDDQWEPPVTRGARLVSILDDAIQHLAQAAYLLGMPELR